MTGPSEVCEHGARRQDSKPARGGAARYSPLVPRRLPQNLLRFKIRLVPFRREHFPYVLVREFVDVVEAAPVVLELSVRVRVSVKVRRGESRSCVCPNIVGTVI